MSFDLAVAADREESAPPSNAHRGVLAAMVIHVIYVL
jgi:hypothetical protein